MQAHFSGNKKEKMTKTWRVTIMEPQQGRQKDKFFCNILDDFQGRLAVGQRCCQNHP